jgi:hypothetical protein
MIESHMGRTMELSHPFAGNTLIFCDDNGTYLHYLRCILIWFEAMSGLRINLAKSKLVPIGVLMHIEALASNLRFHVSSHPLKYLGLPLGVMFKAKYIWDSILDRMQKGLPRWKKLYLSKVGQLTLIKSMLSSLPTYFFSLFSSACWGA